MAQTRTGFWFIQGPGWLLLVYLLIAQAVPAFSYEIGVAMGTQEPAARITEVGVAFFKGFAIGDVIVYIPPLLIGLVGHWRNAYWGRLTLSASLGITAYWPAVSLAAVASTRGVAGWDLPNERAYWVVLPIITMWSVIALWLLLAEANKN